jgi:hypothetical protein
MCPHLLSLKAGSIRCKSQVSLRYTYVNIVGYRYSSLLNTAAFLYKTQASLRCVQVQYVRRSKFIHSRPVARPAAGVR